MSQKCTYELLGDGPSGFHIPNIVVGQLLLTLELQEGLLSTLEVVPSTLLMRVLAVSESLSAFSSQDQLASQK
jgi:hypothetical protein